MDVVGKKKCKNKVKLTDFIGIVANESSDDRIVSNDQILNENNANEVIYDIKYNNQIL